MKLQDYLREKVNQYERSHDYAIATDTLRCWIDEWEETHAQPKPRMTIHEMVHYQIRALEYWFQNPTQRQGHAFFNYLANTRPDLAEQIRGGGIDPSHNDSVIPELMKWLKGEIA